eukprot:TRINITY_DN5610_c0_g1_i1.p1 TRINITY_DN5610_c0_g1~~TRINITY_DN5610_c0_g1_i1.p1  ORF type:complete len:101 (+),score=4.50 TRINITY_DN5610_c0_g1_i1:183-485(+)
MDNQSPSSTKKRGRPRKYPRPSECTHIPRPEHVRGVCYQCSSNINNKNKRHTKTNQSKSQKRIIFDELSNYIKIAEPSQIIQVPVPIIYTPNPPPTYQIG